MTGDALSIDEAVELGYALVARLAADSGLRVLAIKGPILAAQGLREPKSSVDVDVLVHPEHFDRMHEALEAVGWMDEGFYDTPGIVPLHSVTHRHRDWPIEIDLHRWFPGLLGDPQLVFDVLLERSTTAEVAHVAVPVPDRVGHVAIAALHYLRDSTSEWSLSKLESLADLVESWSEEDLRELSEFTARTGSAETLAPFLDRVGAPSTVSATELVVSLEAWRTRAEATTTEVLPWLLELRRLPWRRRPAFVWWSVWLTDEHFRSWSGEPMTRGDVMRARIARVRRGLRALPAARSNLAPDQPGNPQR